MLTSKFSLCSRLTIARYKHLLFIHYYMWHPDKHKGKNNVIAKFQEINEAYLPR